MWVCVCWNTCHICAFIFLVFSWSLDQSLASTHNNHCWYKLPFFPSSGLLKHNMFSCVCKLHWDCSLCCAPRLWRSSVLRPRLLLQQQQQSLRSEKKKTFLGVLTFLGALALSENLPSVAPRCDGIPISSAQVFASFAWLLWTTPLVDYVSGHRHLLASLENTLGLS